MPFTGIVHQLRLYRHVALWHFTQKVILLVRLFLKGITVMEEIRGWGKSMLPVFVLGIGRRLACRLVWDNLWGWR